MVSVSGEAGSLRVGYQEAARLGAWQLELLPELPRRYVLRARVRTVRPFWLAQDPKALALEIGRDIWRWALVDARIEGRELTVMLRGAPEVDRGALARKEQSA